jgi:putative ribosome biogenesis GTPase RsgA
MSVSFMGYQAKLKDYIEKKIVFLGNSGVGKSSLIKHFVTGRDFKDSISMTVGAERFVKDVEVC